MAELENGLKLGNQSEVGNSLQRVHIGINANIDYRGSDADGIT